MINGHYLLYHSFMIIIIIIILFEVSSSNDKRNDKVCFALLVVLILVNPYRSVTKLLAKRIGVVCLSSVPPCKTHRNVSQLNSYSVHTIVYSTYQVRVLLKILCLLLKNTNKHQPTIKTASSFLFSICFFLNLTRRFPQQRLLDNNNNNVIIIIESEKDSPLHLICIVHINIIIISFQHIDIVNQTKQH